MARMPGAVWKPLPEAGAPDGYVKTQFIVHSTGTRASAANNWGYFAKGDVVVESTFIIGETAADPTLQIMDSTDRADANGSANNRGISVEVVGDGVAPYTQWQIDELIRIGQWAASTHPIAKRVIPSEAASGFGWHVMFGAPGPWTSVRGKVCPGNARIEQLKRVVFPAIFANANANAPKPAPAPAPVQEDDMNADQDQWLREIHWQLHAKQPSRVAGSKYVDTPVGYILNTDAAVYRTEKAVAAQAATIKELVGAVGKLAAGEDFDEAALIARIEAKIDSAVGQIDAALEDAAKLVKVQVSVDDASPTA